MKRLALILSLFMLIMIPMQLWSQYTWDNGAGNNVWEDNGNWTGGIGYPQNPGDTCIVDAVTFGAPDVTFDTITIDDLQLTGTVTNSSGNLFTIEDDLTISGTFDGGAGGLSVDDASGTGSITLTGDSVLQTTGPLTINVPVDGIPSLTVNSNGGAMTLGGNVSFGQTTPLNNLTLSTTLNPAPLIPDIDIDGDLIVNFSGDPSVYNVNGATIDVTGNADFTGLSAIGLNLGGNPATLTFGSFSFNAVNVEMNEADAVVISGGSVVTNLTISAAGSISQTGAIDQTGVGTNTFTVANGQDILLNNAGNSFNDDVVFSASAGSINDIDISDDVGGFDIQAGLAIGGSFNLDAVGDIVFLGAFSTTGTPVGLTATGAITATAGALDVSAGTLNLDSGNFSAVTLSNAGNDFGTVATTGIVGDATIVDSNDIVLGNFDTGTDDLRVSAGGTVTQTGVITTVGLALEGTGPVNLRQANEFDALAVNVTNQVDVRDSDGDGFDINTVLTVATASASTLVLVNDGGTATQTNAIAATNLLFEGAGAFTLTDASNAIDTLASSATGDIAYTDADAFTVGSVTDQVPTTVNGIDSGGANVTLESDTAGIAVNQIINATWSSGDVLLTAQGAVTQTAEIICDGLEFYGSGPFTLLDADNDITEIAGDVTGDIDIFDANGFVVFNLESPPDGLWATGADITLRSNGLVRQDADHIRAVGLRLLGDGPFRLTDAANDVDTLAINVTGQVDFWDSDGFVLGAVQGTDLVTTGDDLVLISDAGMVTQTREIELAAGGLLLRGAGAFTLTDPGNDIVTIASDATGDISYTDSANIDVGSVTDQLAATVNGIASGGANVTLTASAGAAVINQALNAGAGNLTVTTTGGGISQGVGDTVTATGTSTLTCNTAGDDILLDFAVNNFGTLEATGDVVRIQEAGALTLADISATTFELDADGAVDQSVGTSIQAANVDLTGAGSFALTEANDADVLAGNATGNIFFTDSDELEIGSVTSTGLTSGGNIGLEPGGGATGLTQTQPIVCSGLLLQGTGPFSLDLAGPPYNSITTLAADGVSGLIDFLEADGFAVGTVNDATATPVNGVVTTVSAIDTVDLETAAGNIAIDQVLTTLESAITVTVPGSLDVNAAVTRAGATPASGDVTFDVGVNLTLDGAVAAGPDNLILNVDGAASQTVAASGTGLELIGTGSFDLTGANNDFTDIAGDISGGAGTIAYAEADDIDVDSVGGSAGLTTAGQDISITSAGGPITVTQTADTGTGTAGDITLTTTGGGTTIDLDAAVRTGTGDLTLDAGGAVNQSVAFTDVTGLELLGAGPFNLNAAGGNEVTTLAANVTGNVAYIDSDALSVGTVNTVGATLAGNVLDIETINGGLAIANPVDSNGGNIVLDAGTTAGGTLTFNAATAADAGDITATSTGLISQNAAGAVTSTGATSLTADSGAADIDLTLAANQFGTLAVTADQAEVAQSGAALDLGNIDATIFSLDSDSAVTQTAGVVDDGSGTGSLLLLGAGPFRLTQATNDIGTLAANVTGNLTYRDADAYSVGSVLGQNGINTATAGVVISLIADGQLDQSQPIVAAGAGAGLHLQGTGPFNLDAVATNDVSILSANVSGQLDYEEANDFAVGSLTNTEGTTVNGVATNGNLLDIVAGGYIRIDQPVATGAGQILSFDAGGNIFLTYAGADISTSHANGISLNDPIVLEANSSLDTSAGTGNIALGAAATVNDDGAASDYTLTLDAGGDIFLNADIGATQPPVDLTLTAGGADANPAAGTDVQVSRDFIVSGGTTYNMDSQTVDAGRHVGGAGTIDITGTGNATVTAGQNVQITTLTVNDLTGAATINVGANLTSAFTPGDNLDDTDADSTVVFTNATAGGGAGAYSFHNLTINDPGNTVTSTGNWTVYGTLTLTDGTWDLDGNTHTIYGSWDSTLNAFTFDTTTTPGSTVIFDGSNAATLRTDGIGTEAFDNIEFAKDTATAVTLGASLDVSGNLDITSGQFAARNAATGYTIQVAGDWTDATSVVGDGFIHRNGEVIFDGGTPTIQVGTGLSPYFYDLTIRDASGTLGVNNLVVGRNLTIDADTAASDLTANVDLTVNGAILIDAAADVAEMTCSGVFTANGSVTLQGANAPVLDLTDQEFHFDGGNNTLNNILGTVRYTGEQAVQDFPTVTAGNENRYGDVVIYAGAADGQILESTHMAGLGAPFWNLTVNAAGRTVTTACDVTIWGYSDPNGDGTLTTPVAAGGPGLNGLRIQAGSLDSSGGDITLYGSFVNSGGTFLHGNNSVVFRDDYPCYIEGNNDFFGFIADNADVAGKIFYIETGGTITMVDDPAAIIRLHGTNANPEAGPLLPPPLSFVGPPRSFVYLVSSDPGNAVPYWNFVKNLQAQVDFQYVYILHSDAGSNPQVVPDDVVIEDCIDWYSAVFVQLSWTRDIGGGYPNGRIDRILVKCNPSLNMDFSGFEAEVDGYTVTGYMAHYDHPWEAETADPTMFYILLEEQDVLDTGSTPAWRIVQNTTLRDTTIGRPVNLYDGTDVGAPTPKTEEVPYDDADPVIGYTLSVTDKDEIFVHFSEPVIQNDQVTEIDTSNFNTTAGGGLSAFQRVSPTLGSGTREILFSTAADITAAEILASSQAALNDPSHLRVDAGEVYDFVSPTSTHLYDTVVSPDAADTADQILFSTSHRISDVGLGILGNGMVEPVNARGGIQPSGGVGTGIETDFDGSGFLPDDDFDLQAHRYTGLGETPDLVYANSISSAYRNGDLWLPAFGEDVRNAGEFSGLVPQPYAGTSSYTGTYGAPANTGDLFEYSFLGTDGMVADGRDLEFFFHFTVSDLYAGRIVDDTASDWYRGVRPWSLPIRNIVTQAGGISILNNIINPNRNERTSLHYELTQGGTVVIQVFDLAGGLVEILQRGYQAPGEYSVSWNGRNRAGNAVARGIYFIRYVGPGGVDQIRKVLVVK